MVEYPDSNLCPNCGGDGLDGEDFCLPCSGTGYVSSHGVNLYRRDLQNKVNDLVLPVNVFDSYLVLEELNATEYNALTDAQKDGVLHILACGKVDLNTGKVGRVRLWNWFGVESTTVANLTALLS